MPQRFTSVGRKSEDPLSPAYTPSLFSFTSSPKKRRAEQGLDRYEATKWRQEEKDRVEAADALVLLVRKMMSTHVTPILFLPRLTRQLSIFLP